MPPMVVPGGFPQASAAWLAEGGVTLTGRVLAEVGVQSPGMLPEHLLMLQLTRM